MIDAEALSVSLATTHTDDDQHDFEMLFIAMSEAVAEMEREWITTEAHAIASYDNRTQLEGAE